MAALPVLSSDDEQWSTENSLLGDRDDTERNVPLDEHEAALFVAARTSVVSTACDSDEGAFDNEVAPAQSHSEF
eukprot:3937449-Pleurochrysis_carterae.AAC.1